jgi:hypothetical protein
VKYGIVFDTNPFKLCQCHGPSTRCILFLPSNCCSPREREELPSPHSGQSLQSAVISLRRRPDTVRLDL